MPADFAGTWQKNIVKSAIAAAAKGAAAKVEERRRTTPAVFLQVGKYFCYFCVILLLCFWLRVVRVPVMVMYGHDSVGTGF